MGDRPLHCNIKNPVFLTVEDHKNVFHSGCKVVDVTFPNIAVPENQKVPISFCERVGKIHFKNYYVAYLSIRVKFKPAPDNGEPAGEIKWKTCLRRMRLMPNPHTESGSQDFFCITRKHLSCDLTNIFALRLILQQPSPVWKDFRIEELKMYRSSENLSKPPPLPGWLTEESTNNTKRKIENGIEADDGDTSVPTLLLVRPDNSPLQTMAKESGIPNLDAVSANVQQLWALSEEVAANQTQTALGRYEVDGCYEINLLSYT